MINWKDVLNLRVFKTIRMKPGATIVTENSDGTTTSLAVSELAALNDLATADLAKIDGITDGTAAANKAVVLDASKGISTITSATITTLTSTTVNATTVDTTNIEVTNIKAKDGTAAGSIADSTGVVTLTSAAGTTLAYTNIDAGASGTAGSVDVFPATASKGKLILAAVNNDGDTNVTISNAAMGQASVISIPDPGAATANFVLTSAANDGVVVTATSAELNYNDITTLGTLAASKAWTSDASLDTIMPTGGLLTVQSGGAVTFNSGSTMTVDGTTATTVAAAEHGAGAIGTAATPKTRRWTDRGVIVTQTTFDLTGLASVATANDVIGLTAGGAAYIGRNVVATNGVIFKVELSCLETPLTGDNDVNVVANASATLVKDDAGGTTYLSNSGDLLVGQTIQNLLPGLTEGDYYYLTAGTGDTAGTYTAGMYVLTTYGHAVLA